MSTPLTGRCQCGAVRYRAAGTDNAVLCHCRMCQRAVGGPFGWMVSTVELTIEGPAGWFRSSTAADRGFCPKCGTPLFFQLIGGEKVWVTGGSLDDPSLAPPKTHYGAESRHCWTALATELPSEETQPGGLTGVTAPVQSYQGQAPVSAKEER